MDNTVEIKCQECGKDEVFCIVGPNYSINYCMDHISIEKHETKLPYKDNASESNEIKNLKHLLDICTVENKE